MQKVSNHYVPQFYLKNFSNNKKSIGMYHIKHHKYIKEASIKKQACKDYLYGEDGTLEDMLMEIENHCSKIIRRIIETSRLPSKDSQDYALLLLFILLSEARNLKTANSINNFIDTQMKILLKMDKQYDIPDDVIDKLKISMTIPNLNPILSTFELYPILFDLKGVLLVTKNDRQFITSDNPLVRYNQFYVHRKYTLRGYGLGNMGIQLFFPISPQLCICIFDHVLYDYKTNKDGNIEINKGKHMDEINKLIYLNAYTKVFFNDKTTETYINRLLGSIKHKNTEIDTEIDREVTIFGTEYNKLIAYSPRKVNERVNLAFFSIRREFMDMPLPLHMAGPVRPYADKFMKNLRET
jgi:hypothetical protein